MSEVEIYREGPCYCSVCAPKELTSKEVEVHVNLESWTGIESPWRISEEDFATGEKNPHTCEDDESRKHWLLFLLTLRPCKPL